ncbi:MAG: choice-of-anchor D domain-containing protein, partial [Candidatus Cloacimonadaceae bacterium]|nr:choice-of-anchor D domain-containing protein [Candidatus Cloacimonadaceae bacterium]
AERQFTITNLGNGILSISAGAISITDDPDGNFSLNASGLPVSLAEAQAYHFSVTFSPQTSGAKTANLRIVESGEPEIVHWVELSGFGSAEELYTVINLGAEQIGSDVVLSWNGLYGNPGNPSWMHWDSGTNHNSIGTGSAANFDVAAKFKSTDYGAYNGMYLSKIRFFPMEQTASYTIKIWSGQDNELAPEYLLYSQPVANPQPGVWNTIDIPTPIFIDGIASLYIGYNVDTQAGYPAGCDQGPLVPDRGALIYWNGSWIALTDLYPDTQSNWNLQAYFETESRNGISNTQRITKTPVESKLLSKEQYRNHGLRTAHRNTSRALLGFSIFRDGTLLNPEPINTFSYTDANVPYGFRNYGVRSHHISQTGPMSAPVTVEVTAPAAPLPIPFTETWVSNNFTAQYWIKRATNWSASTIGNPAPAVRFTWDPTLYNYFEPLSSHYLDATGISNLMLSFDLSLDNYSTLSENLLSVQVYSTYHDQWFNLQTFSSLANSGLGWPFQKYYYDISDYAADQIFRIRFLCEGENSYEINYWYIDNIEISEVVEPVFSYTPESWDFGTCVMNSANHKEIVLSNLGGGFYPIQSIEISGDYFSIEENPAPTVLGIGQNASLLVRYYPTVEGFHTGSITISSGRLTSVIDLAGTSADPTIYLESLPLVENFDSLTLPSLPFGWVKIVSSTHATAGITTTSSIRYSPPNALYIRNTIDPNSELIFISPLIIPDLSDVKLRFWVRGSTGRTLHIGSMANQSDASTFEIYHTINPSNTLVMHDIDMFAYSGSNQYLAFKRGGNTANDTIYLDDISLALVPIIDLAIVKTSGNSVLPLGETCEIRTDIINNGQTPQDDYQIKLIDSTGTVLAEIAGPPVNPQQTVSIPIYWQAPTAGSYEFYTQIVLQDDQM